jgi:hypothetical protein
MPLFFSGSGAKYTYDRFPSNIRSEEQEEKRKQILAAASGAFEYIKHAPRYLCILRPWVSTWLYSNFRCLSLIPNCSIPNFSYILASSPSVQVGKDSLSPMERAVSSLFHDWCNSGSVLEIGNYLNDEHICFAGRKGAYGFGH